MQRRKAPCSPNSASVGKVCACFWSTVFQRRSVGDGFTSGGSATAGAIIVSFDSADTFPYAHNVAIAICRVLHSHYPAGDGSIAILRSMLPKSRRVDHSPPATASSNVHALLNDR
jgi:hypothetical protein